MPPVRLAKYVWARLVNGDDRVRRLGPCRLHFWACRLVEPLIYRMKSAGVYWMENLGQSPRYPRYGIVSYGIFSTRFPKNFGGISSGTQTAKHHFVPANRLRERFHGFLEFLQIHSKKTEKEDEKNVRKGNVPLIVPKLSNKK